MVVSQDHLKQEIKNLLDQASDNKPVEARELARVVGKLVACDRALGPVIRIMNRSVQRVLDTEVLERGWETSIVLPNNALSDWQSVLENLDEQNGQPIFTSKSGVPLNSYAQGILNTLLAH